METRQLRESAYKDYVAIDLVKEDGTITNTPFYYKGDPIRVKVHDDDDNAWYKCEVIGVDYEKRQLKMIDLEGWVDLKFDLDFDDLSDSKVIKFYPQRQ